MWGSGKGALPEGEAICRPCRKLHGISTSSGRPTTRPLRHVVCDYCETEFETRNAIARYCNVKCFRNAQARDCTTNRACEICAGPFRTHRKDQRTCSRNCGVILRYLECTHGRNGNSGYRSISWKVYFPTCQQCERVFTAPRMRDYCTVECYRIARRRADGRRMYGDAATATCTYCAIEFAYTLYSRPRTTCDTCAEMIRRTSDHRERARFYGVDYEYVNSDRVFERDAGVCKLCGYPADMGTQVPHPLAPTLDHIVPMSIGGPHKEDNVQLAHFDCNVRKGARLVFDGEPPVILTAATPHA